MLATEESSQGAGYLCHDGGGAPDRTRDLRQTIKHYQLFITKREKIVNVPNFMKQGEDKETFGCI